MRYGKRYRFEASFTPRKFYSEDGGAAAEKTAIIAKEEELTFAALNQRVQALAGTPASQDGIRQGDRVGVLLPNSTAIPLSYYSTQKIGAVTVILDARLKAKS